ncbi:MAG: TIGR04211 family SH3 domain-containing protein [Gammaproteobacteria bacterium]|nr:MAG: TIGR04211 family SH3 domain-containing protein [Gammaproteobacteria bacterium]
MVRKLVLIVIAVLSGTVSAQTKYVSDQLRINLRSGKSNTHRIISSPRSGTELKVLEVDRSSGYTKVQLPSGTIGWALTRQLMGQPSARTQLADLTKRNLELVERAGKMRSEKKDLTQEIKELSAEKKQLTRANKQLTAELTELKREFGGEISFQDKYINLQKELQDYNRQIEALEQLNADLESKDSQLWVMVGGGILLLGLILGLIIPKVRWQKKSSWSSL